MAVWCRTVLCLTYALAVVAFYDYNLDDDVENHLSNRIQIIGQEALMSVGGSLDLSDNEEIVNERLMKYKLSDLDESYDDASKFLGSKHFFHAKDQINKKPVFDFIKDMPKGAALHVHDVGIVDVDYVIKNITYRKHLYMCYEEKQLKIQFMPSTNYNNECNWQLVSELRHHSGNQEKFDADLRKHFSLWDNQPERLYPNIDTAWSSFQGLFTVLFPMITYEPVWRDYFYEALTQFYKDNILYVELRSVLPNLYDFDRKYEVKETVKVLEEVVNDFKKEYPDFIGAKIIYAPMRNSDRNDLVKNIQFAYELQDSYPNFFAGFDLVGREDQRDLLDFVDELTGIKNMSVFYHSGETNWYGFSTDYNLIDAVLFGAKRLGHAYALAKHPKVMDYVMQEHIALEINPISNQVLKLVEDFRNHPAAIFLANNYPVVISSDDPGLWGALPLSHDFFITFNYIASRHADIRLLKQLAINSISYSSLSLSEKYDFLHSFNSKWTEFIDQMRKQL